MDETVFDAMLKTALEEALRREAEEISEPPAPSRRHRKRMRKLLAGSAPERSAGTAAERKLRTPARWLAVVVIAALLTGAAAGLALGDGEWFRQWFDQGDWAGYYGGAANTEQLLGMGVEMEENFAESNGMRLEVVDAVFDGQRLLMFVRMTMLDQTLREWFQEHEGLDSFDGFEEMEFLSKDKPESTVNGWGMRFTQDMLWAKEPEEGEYFILFELDLASLEEGGQVELRLADLRLWETGATDNVWPGEWTLGMTLKPAKTLRLASPQPCRVNGVDWVLDSLFLSPLTLRMELRCLGEKIETEWRPFEDFAIHMKNGETVGLQGCSSSLGIGGHHISARFDFAMPLDLEQVDYIHVCGEDLYLEE